MSPAEVSRISAIVFIYHHMQVMRQAPCFFLHLFLNLQVMVLSLYPTDASVSQLLSSVDIEYSSSNGTQPQPTQSPWVRIYGEPMAFSGQRFFLFSGRSLSETQVEIVQVTITNPLLSMMTNTYILKTVLSLNKGCMTV